MRAASNRSSSREKMPRARRNMFPSSSSMWCSILSFSTLNFAPHASSLVATSRSSLTIEISDVVLLEPLEDDFARLWMGLQGGIQNFLFHQFVSIQIGREARQKLAARGARAFGRFFALLQERFEATMLPLEDFDRIGLRSAARDFAADRCDGTGHNASQRCSGNRQFRRLRRRLALTAPANRSRTRSSLLPRGLRGPTRTRPGARALLFGRFLRQPSPPCRAYAR